MLSCALAATSLTGCSLLHKNDQSGPINQKSETEDTSVKPEADPVPDLPVDLPETEPGTDPETDPLPLPEPEVSNDRYLLDSGFADAPFYIVDKNGTKTGEFTDDEIIKGLPLDEDDYFYVQVIGIQDGIVYSTFNGNNEYKVIAFDPETKENKIIWDSNGLYIAAVDLYNDHIYVLTDKYDSSYDNIRFYETELTRVGDSLDYTEADAPSTSLLSKVSDYTFQLPFVYRASYTNKKCMTRILDEIGFAVAVKDDAVCTVSADGKAKKLKLPENTYVNVYAYDGNFAYLNWYDQDNGNYMTYCYDFSVDRYEEIGVVETIMLYEGNYYYAVDESEEYGIRDTHVYAYDPDGGRSTEQYEYLATPGARNCWGTNGFSIIDGQVYIVGVEKHEYMWLRVNYDESGASYTDIYCPISDIPLFEYGDVNYTSGSVVCPKCEKTVYKFYFETFNVDSNVCLGYKTINEALNKRMIDKALSSKEHYEESLQDNDCEYHEDERYCETEEMSVESVEVLFSKYITIDMGYYWYAGGAHGMPGIEQYVFDLDTGDELIAAEMFNGTEEDFKELVAQAVVDDYAENPDKYYIEGGSVYDTAYEYAGLTSTTIKFEEDGVYVYFAPYSLGPYASGFIGVKLSYKDFLGRDSL